MSDTDFINIAGWDKAVVLMALYNKARAQGVGELIDNGQTMSWREAKDLLRHKTYFDYVGGRVLKVDLSSEVLDTRLYDRDNGLGAAQAALKPYLESNRHSPKKIDEYYAWVCIEDDGGEGIPAYSFNGKDVLPLIGADRESIESLRPFAIYVAGTKNTRLKLVKFENITVLEEINLDIKTENHGL